MKDFPNRIRWVVHFQGLKWPKPWEHLDEVPNMFQYIDKPELTWGSGIYYVQTNGDLVLVEDDYDSSD
jgi:hypothetical protein